MDILDAVKSGVLLNELLARLFPGSISMGRVITSPANVFESLQNHNISLEQARSVGIRADGIGAENLQEASVILVFSFLWQIIKHGLLSNVTADALPEGFGDGEGDDDAADLRALHPEKLLLKWVNWHLRRAGSDRRMTNFTSDVTDSEIYAVLLAQLAPEEAQPVERVMEADDPVRRAELVLEGAERLDCKRFVTAADVCAGNYKLNLAFVANLFNELRGRVDAAALDNAAAEHDRAVAALTEERDRLARELREAQAELERTRGERSDLRTRVDELSETVSRLRDGESETAASLEAALETARAERDAAVREAREQIESTKAGARDWFARKQQETEQVIERHASSREAWTKKATEKEELLRKYRDALAKARAERDAARARADAAEEATKAAEDAAAAAAAAASPGDDAAVARLKERLDAAEAAAVESGRSAAASIESMRAQAYAALEAARAETARAVAAARADAERVAAQQRAAWDEEREGLLKLAQGTGDGADAAALDEAKRARREAKAARKEVESLRAQLRRLRPLCKPLQGPLLKYGQNTNTWNRRVFEQSRDLLLYFRDDGSFGGAFDMEKAKCFHPTEVGLKSATSSHTLGFNKPTAFEWVVRTPKGLTLRLCAASDLEERRWRRSIEERTLAWQALDDLVKNLD
jgi:predicted  nucleic acid-binding Zn-ribbon protein